MNLRIVKNNKEGEIISILPSIDPYAPRRGNLIIYKKQFSFDHNSRVGTFL